MPETKPSETKTSKLLACDPHGEPYAQLAKFPDTKTGQGYMLVFESGDQGILMSHIPEAHGPSSNGFQMVIGTEYRYTTYTSKRGTAMVDVLAATTPKDIAKTHPGVTTAASLPAKEEKVSPQLTEPKRTFAEAAASTKKITPEELAAEAKIHPNQPISDSQPRKGTIKSIKADGDFTPKDGSKQYKYAIVMTDGATGVMWTPEITAPVKEGQEINYTFGKVYQDGSKRIDMAAIGSAVDKETMIMRMGCLNTAVGFMNLAGYTLSDHTVGQLCEVAKQLEAHVMRSID